MSTEGSGSGLETGVMRGGGSRRRPNARERVRRDALIVERKAEGWRPKAIAEEAGISERQVRRVVEHHGNSGSAWIDRDPVDILNEIVSALEKSIGDFELQALEFVDHRPAAAVAALGAAVDAQAELLSLLLAADRLPTDGFFADFEPHEHAAAMVDGVRDFRRGVLDADDLDRTFERITRLGVPGPT